MDSKGFVRKDVTDKSIIIIGTGHGGPAIAGWTPISVENAEMLDLKKLASNVVKSLDKKKSELSTSYIYTDGIFGVAELDLEPQIVSGRNKTGFLVQYKDTKNIYLYFYQDRCEFWPEQDIKIIVEIFDEQRNIGPGVDAAFDQPVLRLDARLGFALKDVAYDIADGLFSGNIMFKLLDRPPFHILVWKIAVDVRPGLLGWNDPPGSAQAGQVKELFRFSVADFNG